jgi:hypothetical protein
MVVETITRLWAESVEVEGHNQTMTIAVISAHETVVLRAKRKHVYKGAGLQDEGQRKTGRWKVHNRQQRHGH